MVNLQLSLALLHSSQKSNSLAEVDQYGRKPPNTPELEGVLNVSDGMKAQYLSQYKLGALAQKYGIVEVMRWKPKQVCRLFPTICV